MLFGEGPGARPAAHRAGPRHALPPRAGVLPRRQGRRRATTRPSRRPCGRRRRRPASTPAGVEVLRRAARAVAAAEQLRGHPGARLVAGGVPGRRGRPGRGARRAPGAARPPARSATNRVTVAHPQRLLQPRLPDRGSATWCCGASPPGSSTGCSTSSGSPGRGTASVTRSSRRTCCGRWRRRSTGRRREVSMNLLDWVLIVLVVAYALSGYWQGFIAGAFATVGLVLGGLLGIWLAPHAARRRAARRCGSRWGRCSSCWWLRLLRPGASPVRRHAACAAVTWQPVRALDALGGAALSVVAVLVVGWMLGVAVSGSRIPAIGTWCATPRCCARSTTRCRGGLRRAARLRPGGRLELLPPLPRAVRPRADRAGGARPAQRGAGPRDPATPSAACTRSAATTAAAPVWRAPASSTRRGGS